MRALIVVLALMVSAKADAMPWPCWLVKIKAEGKSESELRAMAREYGYRITHKLEREVRACLKDKK